jgi:hypothetical protein
MKWYIAKRLLQLIPVLLGVAIISFSLIHLAPGDPARTIAGEHASEQTIQTLREKYGLDRPLYVQFWLWFEQVLRGDFGRSIVSNEFVMKEILNRFPNTVELAFFSMLIAIVVGFVAGVISASKQYSFLDYTTMGVALFGVSMPVFWLGIMLMMIFGVFFRYFVGTHYRTLYHRQPRTGQLESARFDAQVPYPPLGSTRHDSDGYHRQGNQIEHARGAATGLHQDGTGEGAVRAGGDIQARSTKRNASGHHSDRAELRTAARRCPAYGDGVLLARYRAIRGEGGTDEGLPGGTGVRALLLVHVRNRKSHY